MRYKLLGKSGLRVSELCLGTMTFGEEWGWGASKEESGKIFDLFATAGGNFIDTANHYTNGTSEKYVGEFIRSERERFVVATKYTLNGRPSDPNGGGNHRKSLVQALEASLKRLGTEYIDIYWVHAWDGITPIEETMRALDDQVRAGKILYTGISDAPAWVIAQANTLAQTQGLTSFVSLQAQYNLIERTAERELLPMAKAFDIAVTVWSPLAGGVLSGKYNNPNKDHKRFSEDNPARAAFVNERNLTIAEAVNGIARDIRESPASVALNWIRQKKAGVLIPVLGARTPAQLASNLDCLKYKLTDEYMVKLDAASQFSLGFPHDFVNLPMVAELIHGTAGSLVDNHRK